MAEQRKAIIKLFEKGKRVREIGELLDVLKSKVHDIIARFNETGINERRPGSGRPRTAKS